MLEIMGRKIYLEMLISPPYISQLPVIIPNNYDA